MRLVVVSHKRCWRAEPGSDRYVTDGGFPLQIGAVAQLFDATTVCVPVAAEPSAGGHMPLPAAVQVVPLPEPSGRGVWRKLLLPVWFARSLPALVRAIRSADVVHTPIPGDVGTVGIVLAHLFRKRLFVRHCGNWQLPRTRAERLWRGYMERFAGSRRVMLATGGGSQPPSPGRDVAWIFSTSLTEAEVRDAGRARQLEAPASARLVTAGRQVEAKGTGRVLEALARLRTSFPELHLDVIGDGPDLTRFRQQAAELGVAGAVTFHGQVDHDTVMKIIDGADLFVFPTTSSEGFPKVVTEAMAAGLPIVTTAVSVLPSLLQRGAGVLIEEPTPAAVASAVERVLSDPAGYARMSEAALDVASTLTLERWRDEIGDRLERVWGPLGTTAPAGVSG